LVAVEKGKMNDNSRTTAQPRRTTFFSDKTLEESYAFCREIGRRSHSNFISAFLLLPRPLRIAMEAIYAFMRFADDLVDEKQPASACSPSAAEIENRREQLVYYRWLLVNIYQMALSDSTFQSSIPYPKEISESAGIGNRISPALIDTIDRFGIPYEIFTAILDGVEMDLAKNRYATFAELELYCERVASAVGLACIHVWGFEGRGSREQETVFELARRVGIAYQLTNILRDVKEDAAMDRVYLPLDEITAAGYSVEELKRGAANPAFEKLMRVQIDRAVDYYRAGRELYVRLKPEGKKIFGLMTATYRLILRKIAARPVDVFQKRVRIGALDRMLLAARWTCFAPKDFKP
jgi:15-cis-phytoene synthase